MHGNTRKSWKHRIKSNKNTDYKKPKNKSCLVTLKLKSLRLNFKEKHLAGEECHSLAL